MNFDEWFDIEGCWDGSDEDFEQVARNAYNAGMERAAQIAEERGHLALPHVIREEIERDNT